ncbi:glycosyltransferase [Paraburkholderia bonniea]|uniref:glycosyltransferase family 2 protein n=1 Tax=Paraburkholderia bonniea TaxID=2152891 RepID=UPI001290D914|nr:glycosyltransferase family 2 protein [Paraburkholderia bonniea]WJF91334.1 glycosyltransferase [Paraburkholderia bonniea]WJF94649.1 glycosyltransferase [Paraburkholderia bonniea]
MSFSVCLVIPIYNHKEAITETVARLQPHGLPLIIVDDGSDAATQDVLAKLAERVRHEAGALTLLRLPRNGGKGAAVIAGLRAARRMGYTHALQIDADGQHDAADVPRFVAAAREQPDAVILGQPVFDASVPKSRLYGRYMTHVWVWIETLSFTIRDSMCGFRLYPLDAACALIDAVKLPQRMAFDISVLVRLHWRGVAFHGIPTRVTYAPDGVSHFDVLWDNVRISAAHARLVAGMLLRLPLLLARKVCPKPGTSANPANPARHPAGWWRIAERGSRVGMALLALSSRVLGRRITALWLYPVVFYFLLTGRAARDASTRYFTQLRASTPQLGLPRPGWVSAYRHMLAFAQAAFDKLGAWSGRVNLAEVSFDDPAAFDALTASGRGALVIGAHLGNLEMSRALATHGARAKVSAIVYSAHARRFNDVLASVHPAFPDGLLEVSDFGPETAMLMQARIEAGELLVIVGDRVPACDAGRTTEVPFLGAPARFAQGPFVLAHALGCPVYLFFCLKERSGYHLYFEPFAERIALPRRERAGQLAVWTQRYASRLEHYCRKAPFQWFNFFDFWARPDGGANG